MAKPSFILLAKSTLIDRDTNELSVFGIVEKMQVSPIPEVQIGTKTIVLWEPLRLIAEWIRDPEDDTKDEFEYEFSATIPGKSDPIQLTKGTFSFFENKKHRMILAFKLPFPLENATGILRFYGKVRKSSTSEWSPQSYDVFVEFVESSIATLPIPPFSS